MKRLYQRAAAVLWPHSMQEIGQGADPRMVRAFRLAADELRNKAEYASGGYGPTVKVSEFEQVCADVLRIVKRHVWREMLGKEP
jgi:hypothetical protein